MNGKKSMRKILWILLIFFALVISGCWDRTEVSDLALITAVAFDKTPEGKLQLSGQILLPAGDGTSSGQGEANQQKGRVIVDTTIGVDPDDAVKKAQKKFSRKLFRGHRRIIIIGEEMGKYGLGEMLDYLIRDPNNSLSTPIVVAKGRTGYDMLKINYPLERNPAEAMREMINLGMGGSKMSILNFLIKASTEGIQPIMPVIEPEDGQLGFKLAGIAIFKDLKLVGYLNAEETNAYRWVRGEIKYSVITTALPEHQGEVSVDVLKAKARITPEIRDDKVTVYVELKGEGSIHGNNTKLDLNVPNNIVLIEKEVATAITKQVEQTIAVVQREYGSDIFGFGSSINQRNPQAWKRLSGKWDNVFPDVEVSVSTDFTIRMTGMTGPSVHLKENEVEK